MKKTIAFIMASAMLFACVGCVKDNGDNNSTPDVTSQAGVVQSPDNRPTAGVNHTLEPVATYEVPVPTQMIAVTPAPVTGNEDMSAPFANGAYASSFVKTPEKSNFSAPGYMGYTVAKSKADIDAYIAKFESMIDFDSEFKEAVSKYNDSFFESKSLIFIMHDEAKGSTSGRVKSVEQFEDYLSIIITCDTNWSSYADPQSVEKEKWHCIIEINSDDIVNNDITVFEFE